MLAAADELRTAVHHLATATIGHRHDPSVLHEAQTLVARAAALLDGEPLAPWWDGPGGGDIEGLRAYRHRSLFQGPLHPFSPALRWGEGAGPEGQPGLSYTVTLPRLYEGPPRAVHGGYVAGLFDELLGAVQARATGGGGYTGKLEVRYRALTPVETPVRFTGWIVANTGRRITTAAVCHDHDDAVCAEATGLFVRPRHPVADP